jgi:hypothetical protein
MPLLKNDGLNFQMWKHRTKLVLQSCGLMGIVEGTEKNQQQWIQMQSQIGELMSLMLVFKSN